jgi:hypothetical protein
MHTEKRIVIHVGLHKTGSTSIQEFLFRHRAALRAQGVDVYSGMHIPSNRVELHTVAMRFDTAAGYSQISEQSSNHGRSGI